ncbi:MAG: ATP-dependent sacrificial sulfur transferase LarE [Clostridia bacterium]|nr:ATP-dependent sacrificial sulfur transferase LarE [Clostridia bacterium]
MSGRQKLEKLLGTYSTVAVAYSGGVDSALLAAAAKNCGLLVQAYGVWTELVPESERRQAVRAAEESGLPLHIIRLNLLDNPLIQANSSQRCYFCKKQLLQSIQAKLPVGQVLLDGTNASDLADERPGMRALLELGVISPLREAGLSKAEVRQWARELGLSVWNKPSYSCLATRIATGQELEVNLLQQIEQDENFLRNLGLQNFRLRIAGKQVNLQIAAGEKFDYCQVRKYLASRWEKVQFSLSPDKR